jgi:hypothetical protein
MSKVDPQIMTDGRPEVCASTTIGTPHSEKGKGTSIGTKLYFPSCAVM